MARRFIDDIVSEITAGVPDNNVGLVEPANLRIPMLDLCDSLVTDEATLDVDTPKAGEAVGATFADYANYDSSAGDDGSFLKINQGAGTVTGTTVAGFSYLVTVSMSASYASNRVVDVAVGQNGVPVGFIPSVAGQGAGDPVLLSTTFFIRSAGSNDVFSLLWKADSATTAEVTDARLTAVIWPTRNP